MLSTVGSDLSFLSAIDPEEAVTDDVKNQFFAKHVIPFIKKVEI
jgi:hypothetical protein